MSHWLLDSISEKRSSALKNAERIQIHQELLNQNIDVDFVEFRDVANALELTALDLILDRFEENEGKLRTMRECATDAFRILRVLPLPEDSVQASYQLLRMSSLAVLGDRGADASRILKQIDWPNLPYDSDDWGKRTWSTIVDVWLRLIRKKGWEDRDIVLQRIADLREQQSQYENSYLSSIDSKVSKPAALELIGLYHLAKAAEIMALFITDGVVDGNFQIRQLLETHFDRALAVCEHARMIDFEPMTRLLNAAAVQMVENSIWTVTRAVNSKVTQFVKSLVDRGRGDKALFDVLPPQRRALSEKGLLGSSRRAVVVSLPTSSGKTMISQFRILQALNQFDHEKGWVAYLAPTRALVNQVTRQLRSDFAPLSIAVEKVSPALEVDSVEMDLLKEQSDEQKFRVLVTTPEKLDLMLRQGWETKIGRPLTLVVVDEAHNIQSIRRGLKLELLLATINKECLNAQFLLLTPFINNAREVARWLGGTNSDDISLSLDWQPNDRAIGIVKPVKGGALTGRSFDYSLNFETVHTTRKTITVDEQIPIPKNIDIANTYAQANNQGRIAALAAQFFKERGPVIVMHARPDWVWSLAEHLKTKTNRVEAIHDDVKLLQDYLRLELGDSFPLVDLIEYGIAVHHSGLPEEVRTLIEWLFENERIEFLVATTTIAQGINFPVSGVVMASHQYFSPQGAEDMPPEDFWNIAGRAGRVSQGQLGVVALAADSDLKAEKLKTFINKQTEDLNSALVQLAVNAGDKLSDLGGIVYSTPEWSSFLQYLTHTYQQMGKPESYFQQIEQVLRGTLGFEKLRTNHSQIAQNLLAGIETYTNYLQQAGQPLKLVDSTGFSLQSVNTVLVNKKNINENSWDGESLYASSDSTLQDMMGILLRIPELRDNLNAVTGGDSPDGDKLALILKDWVGGVSISEIAKNYFQNEGETDVHAITKCGQNLFGKLTQTASWGLGALLAITGNNLDEDKLKELSNLPARAFYGVNSDKAIIFRLLGVPRSAADSIAQHLDEHITESLPQLRKRLSNLGESSWSQAMGENGKTYRKVWRIIEGLD
ncbi:MAG: ATP-dependent helicase [Desulfobacterales bacterium RIFOXYA12_FULL_46_15]|nr:MAG: ATP-dependent helicase [Desulfobacterales bacterium RIFOXYA12_FULL_46_15]